MGSIRIIKRPPHELIITDRPLIGRLIKNLIIGGSIGGALLGIGLFATREISYIGSLTTLQCTHQEHLTCKMTVEDARGGLISQTEVSPVQKVDIVPIVASKWVCSGSGEDRECETVKYYQCKIRLHAPQTSLLVPVSGLTQRTASLAELCPKQNIYSAQFEQLISGNQKSDFWSEDTRIGDVLSAFKRDTAAYIPAVFLGVPLLFSIVKSRQKIWIFDKLSQTAELQAKSWFGVETTYKFSTRNLTYISPSLTLWEKRGDRFFSLDFYQLDYQNSNEARLAIEAVEPFLSSELRSYEIGYYIIDKAADFLRLYKYGYTENDYHGSLIWSIDALTKRIKFVNKKPISEPELGWDKIQSLQIVRLEDRDEDGVSYSYELGLVTNCVDSFVSLFRSVYLEHTEQIGEKVAKFLGVPLRKA